MEHIEIEVLETSGPTRDCTAGKIYKALSVTTGMTLMAHDSPVSEDGATFFDDVGDQCAVTYSSRLIKLV